jgi:hypothetical protein
MFLEDSYLMVLLLHSFGGEEFRESILTIVSPDTWLLEPILVGAV